MSTGAQREAAFTALYRRHYAEVFAYARRRVDEAAARDIAAETFLVAWRRLDDDGVATLPWLYRTAYLTLLNSLRSQRRGDRAAARIAALPPPAHAPDPASAHESRSSVMGALERLPAAEREVLLLVVWEGLDVAAAAGVLGCTRGAAAVRLHRARRRLRTVLGGDPADPHPLPSPSEVTP